VALRRQRWQGPAHRPVDGGRFLGPRLVADSRWLAYVESATNSFSQLEVLNVQTREIHPLTSDRYNSFSPTWSSDGKWIYFLSDRMLKTTVGSPWGAASRTRASIGR